MRVGTGGRKESFSLFIPRQRSENKSNMMPEKLGIGPTIECQVRWWCYTFAQALSKVITRKASIGKKIPRLEKLCTKPCQKL